MSDLLTTKEVAARKSVTVKTVNLWAQEGRLPVAEVVPIINARLFDPEVVDAFDPKAPSVAPPRDGGPHAPATGSQPGGGGTPASAA